MKNLIIIGFAVIGLLIACDSDTSQPSEPNPADKTYLSASFDCSRDNDSSLSYDFSFKNITDETVYPLDTFLIMYLDLETNKYTTQHYTAYYTKWLKPFGNQSQSIDPGQRIVGVLTQHLNFGDETDLKVLSGAVKILFRFRTAKNYQDSIAINASF